MSNSYQDHTAYRRREQSSQDDESAPKAPSTAQPSPTSPAANKDQKALLNSIAFLTRGKRASKKTATKPEASQVASAQDETPNSSSGTLETPDANKSMAGSLNTSDGSKRSSKPSLPAAWQKPLVRPFVYNIRSSNSDEASFNEYASRQQQTSPVPHQKGAAIYGLPAVDIEAYRIQHLERTLNQNHYQKSQNNEVQNLPKPTLVMPSATFVDPQTNGSSYMVYKSSQERDTDQSSLSSRNKTQIQEPHKQYASKSNSAAASNPDPTQLVFNIEIKDKTFKPDYLKVERGSIVQWIMCNDAIESNENSLYFEKSRSHVIAFDSIADESPRLSLSKDGKETTFRMQFKNLGVFTYKCQIYTWMKGIVEVVEPISCVMPSQQTKPSNVIITSLKNINSLAGARNSLNLSQVPVRKTIEEVDEEEEEKYPVPFDSFQSPRELNKRLIEVLEEESKSDSKNKAKQHSPVIDFRKVFDEMETNSNQHLNRGPVEMRVGNELIDSGSSDEDSNTDQLKKNKSESGTYDSSDENSSDDNQTENEIARQDDQSEIEEDEKEFLQQIRETKKRDASQSKKGSETNSNSWSGKTTRRQDNVLVGEVCPPPEPPSDSTPANKKQPLTLSKAIDIEIETSTKTRHKTNGNLSDDQGDTLHGVRLSNNRNRHDLLESSSNHYEYQSQSYTSESEQNYSMPTQACFESPSQYYERMRPELNQFSMLFHSSASIKNAQIEAQARQPSTPQSQLIFCPPENYFQHQPESVNVPLQQPQQFYGHSQNQQPIQHFRRPDHRRANPIQLTASANFCERAQENFMTGSTTSAQNNESSAALSESQSSQSTSTYDRNSYVQPFRFINQQPSVPYQYSENPLNHLATASWQPFDLTQMLKQQENKQTQSTRPRNVLAASQSNNHQQLEQKQEASLQSKVIFVVRTLEPDRANKSKKQVAKEFLVESTHMQFARDDRNQTELRNQYQLQQRKEKHKIKKKAYQKRKAKTQKQMMRPCLFDFALQETFAHSQQYINSFFEQQKQKETAEDYKDDFSEEESITEQTEELTQDQQSDTHEESDDESQAYDLEEDSEEERVLTQIEASHFVFQASHRDHFQIQEAQDTMRTLFDQGLKRDIHL